MGTIHQISEFRDRRKIQTQCHCNLLRAAHRVIGKELNEIRRELGKPLVLCLENLETGVPANGVGWDLIYSSRLLASLPAVAAQQIIKTAVWRLKPGGRLLMANLALGAKFHVCARCRRVCTNARTVAEMSQLADCVPAGAVSGKAVFCDGEGSNVFIELYKSCAADSVASSSGKTMRRSA